MFFSFFSRDYIFGGFGDDTITGSDRDDTIFGLTGDDVIDAGAGDDVIFGGFGTDTAVFSGSFEDYDIIAGSPFFFNPVSVVGADGADLLYGVEALQFDDGIIFVDGRNNGPVARGDEVAALEDGGAVFSAAELLANDSDFDGDVLSVTGVSALSEAGASVTLVDGAVSYDPGDLFNALGEGETTTDTFTYTVSDGEGGSETATVTVTITGSNDAPVATVDGFEERLELNPRAGDVPLRIDTDGLLSSFIDADGDALDLSFGETSELGVTVELDDEGFLVYDPYNSTAEFREQLEGFDSVLTDTITFTVEDGNGGFTTETISVEVFGFNSPPSFTGPRDFQVNENETFIAQIEAEDINGNDFEFSIQGGADGNFFELTEDGRLFFVQPQDFETPADADGDNAYEVLIEVTDGDDNFFVRDVFTVTVEDVVEAPDATLVLSEIMYNPASAEDDWEWVEVSNTGAADLDLAGYVIDDGNATQVSSANIASGTVAAGGSAILYNADDLSEQNFRDAWNLEEDVTLIAVTEWNDLALNNGGDTISIWSDFGSYQSDFEARENTVVTVTYDDSGDWPSDDNSASIYLTDLASDANDGSNWARSTVGGTTPVNQGQQSDTDGGNSGGDVGSPGGASDTGGGGEFVLISQVQGSGSESALDGETVTVEGIVTYTTSNGYYVQEEAADSDGDATTSEALFVFTGSNTNPGDGLVEVGQTVEVSGRVGEFGGLTQLSGGTTTVTDATISDLPEAVTIAVSETTDADVDYEAVEGMRVEVVSGQTDEALTVTQNFNLDRFGEITVSAGTQTQPTQLFDAQTQAAEIAALQEANANNRLIIDDGPLESNPSEFAFIPNTSPGDNGNGILDSGDDFDQGGTLRLGAEVTAPIKGILSEGFGNYRVYATETMEIDESTNGGARPETPDDVGGDLQIASFNVLNYFTTLDQGDNMTGPGGSLDPRGASTLDDLNRQTDSLVNALTGTGAEVFAIQEIENNGFGEDSAIVKLTSELDAVDPATDIRFVDPTEPGSDGFIGTDAITTGIMYDANAVTLVSSEVLVFDEQSGQTTFGIAEQLNPYVAESDQVGDFQRNRPATIATFEDNETGETFTVVSVHHKSKGPSNLSDLADAIEAALANGSIPPEEIATVEANLAALKADPNFDQGDGQGFWNEVRNDGSVELTEYLEAEYGTSDGANVLVLGDFNAYAQDDPTQTLRDVDLNNDGSADYVDVIDEFAGGQEDAFSFVFDGQQGTLDQGFASEGLAGNITGATEWHINAQEPDLLSYPSAFNDAGFYSDDVFAASDHDPLIVGLDFDANANALDLM